MITRKEQNKIFRLQNHLGEWLNSEQQIMDLILNGFKELYQSQHLASISHYEFDVDWVKSPFNEDSSSLWYEVMPQEIHSTLFSFKPYKAPEEDGLHAGFWQIGMELH